MYNTFKICPVSINSKMRTIKAYVYAHYGVSNTKDLKKAIGVDGDLRYKSTWLLLADKCVTVTPAKQPQAPKALYGGLFSEYDALVKAQANRK